MSYIQGDLIADYMFHKYGIPRPVPPPDNRSWLRRNRGNVLAAVLWLGMLFCVVDIGMGHKDTERGRLVQKIYIPRHLETHSVLHGKIHHEETSWYGPYFHLRVHGEKPDSVIGPLFGERVWTYINVGQPLWESCVEGEEVEVAIWRGWITRYDWHDWVSSPLKAP